MFSLKRFLDLYLNRMFLRESDLSSRHQRGSKVVQPVSSSLGP